MGIKPGKRASIFLTLGPDFGKKNLSFVHPLSFYTVRSEKNRFTVQLSDSRNMWDEKSRK